MQNHERSCRSDLVERLLIGDGGSADDLQMSCSAQARRGSRRPLVFAVWLGLVMLFAPVAGSRVVPTHHELWPGYVSALVWSPDGRHLAFTVNGGQLAVIGANGKRFWQAPPSVAEEGEPVFQQSP